MIDLHEGTEVEGQDATVARTIRAVCARCGAHAAVVISGAAITGACSVCGSRGLEALDGESPPPARWTA